MVVRPIARRLLQRFGYDVVRRGAPTAAAFYPAVPTCQIPNLGWILERVFGRMGDGRFVEIGAFDGYTYSNTWGLAERGWSGLYVEPVPAFADACRARYADNPRIAVVTAAVGREAGELQLHVSGAYSTADETTFAEDQRLGGRGRGSAVITVPVQTLDALLGSCGIDPGFELLVVDVEGMEAEVFAGVDLATWRPRMVIVELTDMHPTVAAHRDEHSALGRSIADAGYDVVFKNTSNAIFVRRSQDAPEERR